VLQIAAKAIECYSTNTTIPSTFSSFINPNSKAAPFCIGRLVRKVPLGLVIYAARNQHTHFDDKNLREPNIEVFNCLAHNHGYSKGKLTIDPAFDITANKIVSYANNVMSIIGWYSYDTYEKDMQVLLGI